jgi:hypothetical protein
MSRRHRVIKVTNATREGSRHGIIAIAGVFVHIRRYHDRATENPAGIGARDLAGGRP